MLESKNKFPEANRERTETPPLKLFIRGLKAPLIAGFAAAILQISNFPLGLFEKQEGNECNQSAPDCNQINEEDLSTAFKMMDK